MYFIQHKHKTWMQWEQWGAYPSKEQAQKAYDKLIMLCEEEPITMNGVDFHHIHKGYEYRLYSV
jgi:hypothetical protein